MTGSMRSNARAVALALCLALLTALAPFAASAAESYVEYHDLTSLQASARTASLKAAGYRPISLSISSNLAARRNEFRYAGAWVKRAGAPFSVFQDKTLAEYQTLLANLAPGYQPVIISAAGLEGVVRLTGVFERTSKAYVAKQDLSADAAFNETLTQWSQGYILRWITVYGSPAAPKYAAIWEENTQNVSFDWTFGKSASAHQDYVLPSARMGVRPSLVVVSPAGTYSAIWEDTKLSGGWKAFNDITRDQYEAKVATLEQSGWHVVRVSARGTGAATRYAVIFAQTDKVQEREWRMTGTDNSTFDAFDEWVKARMQRDRIRAGQLAIVRDGRLVYARGFTWAESGYPITQPTDVFRVESTTKPITSIVINRLTEEAGPDALQLTDTMQSILEIEPPGGGDVADPRWSDVTVSELLNHAGGWDGAQAGFDPVFNDHAIAAALGAPLPISKSQIATYMAGQPLQFDPGTRVDYSNFGFLLLGQIIEKITGTTYGEAVADLIFEPLGLTRPKVGGVFGNLPDEVDYEPRDPYLVPTALNDSGKLVAINYGGFNIKNSEAAGFLVMAAPDYAKILAAFDQPTNPLLTQASVDQMWTAPLASEPAILRGWFGAWVPDENGDTVNAYHHNGILFGGASLIFHRADGLSFVLLFNREGPGPMYGEVEGYQLSQIANAVTEWPEDDQFPTYGIPSF